MIGNGGSESRPSNHGLSQDAGRGLLAEAIDQAEEQIRRAGSTRSRQERLGSLLAIGGRWEEAARFFQFASAGHPSSARARVKLAHARIEALGEEPGVVWRSLDMPGPPDLPLPYAVYVAAWRELRGGDPDHALALLEALVATARFRLWGHLALAHFLEAGGYAQQAMRAQTHLARLHPAFRAAGPDAGESGRRGEPSAPEASPRPVFWNPLLAGGHWIVARHALACGLWSRAREHLGAAFRCDPRPDRLELALASLARRSGEEEEVLVRLSQALEERPRSAGVRFALGLEYARQGYLIEAAGQLGAAWRLPGWRGRSLRPRVDAGMEISAREARRNFRQALRLGDTPIAEVRLGYLCLLLGLRQYEEALRQVEILDKEVGESADLFYCRGEALAGVGVPGESARCVTRGLQLGGSRRIALDLLDLICRPRVNIREACVPEGS